MDSPEYSFQRELRLLNSRDYSRVFDKAIKANNKAFTLLAKKNSLPWPRLGLVIAKKNLKFAYQRNLIKRLLRESFRLQKNLLDHYDFVILTRRDIAVLPKTDIIRLRDEIFARFCKRYPKKHENNFDQPH